MLDLWDELLIHPATSITLYSLVYKDQTLWIRAQVHKYGLNSVQTELGKDGDPRCLKFACPPNK